VRGPASSVVEVGEGEPVAGTPARARGRASGAQTLAPAEVDLANPSHRGDGARGVVAARGCRAVARGCGEVA